MRYGSRHEFHFEAGARGGAWAKMATFLAWSSLALWLLLPAAALAQETEPPAETEPEAGAAAGQEGDMGTPPASAQENPAQDSEGMHPDSGLTAKDGQVDFQAIEDLLIQDEAVLADPETFSYDPGTRRDPFRSLIVTRQNLEDEPRGERPEGKAGLLIDEIVIEGVYQLADGPVAQVQASDRETSYLLRPGDQLWDGDVVSIDLNEVVFKQTVNDPTALKPFREVVKRLN